MKKTISLLLAAALIVACLPGCGASEEKIKFCSDLTAFRNSASHNENELFFVCANIRKYLADKGITANDNGKDFVPQIIEAYQPPTLDQISDDMARMDACYKTLAENEWGVKHAPEIIEQASEIYHDVYLLASCLAHPTGTADIYKAQYNEYDDSIYDGICMIDEYLQKEG